MLDQEWRCNNSFSSNFAQQITLGIGPGMWTVWKTKRFQNYLPLQNLIPARFIYFFCNSLALPIVEIFCNLILKNHWTWTWKTLRLPYWIWIGFMIHWTWINSLNTGVGVINWPSKDAVKVWRLSWSTCFLPLNIALIDATLQLHLLVIWA